MRPSWWRVLGVVAFLANVVFFLPAFALSFLAVICGAAVMGAMYERRMRRFAPKPEPDNPLIAEVFE